MNAFEAAEKNDRANDLQKELEVLFNGQNTSPRCGCHLHFSDLLARGGLRVVSQEPSTAHGASQD
jgi:hypothetical protein